MRLHTQTTEQVNLISILVKSLRSKQIFQQKREKAAR